jgi:hypothetical protein
MIRYLDNRIKEDVHIKQKVQWLIIELLIFQIYLLCHLICFLYKQVSYVHENVLYLVPFHYL